MLFNDLEKYAYKALGVLSILGILIPASAWSEAEIEVETQVETDQPWPDDILRVDQDFDRLQSLESLSKPSHVPATKLKAIAKKRRLRLKSQQVLVYDLRDQEILFEKHAHQVRPIASLTKLITAMVVLDAKQDMNEILTVTKADKDRILYSRSLLRFGTKLLRYDMLHLALMSSENRAANALARNYPGGKSAFVSAMNRKAKRLGLKHSVFKDPAGLHTGNVSTAWELLKIMEAAKDYPLIRYFTTVPYEKVTDRRRKRYLQYVNTNRLVRGARWKIELSKTGFTSKAGNCLSMLARINGRPVGIVLLNSWGKLSKYGDANRIRQWLLRAERRSVERQYRSR